MKTLRNKAKRAKEEMEETQISVASLGQLIEESRNTIVQLEERIIKINEEREKEQSKYREIEEKYSEHEICKMEKEKLEKALEEERNRSLFFQNEVFFSVFFFNFSSFLSCLLLLRSLNLFLSFFLSFLSLFISPDRKTNSPLSFRDMQGNSINFTEKNKKWSTSS